MAQFFCDNWCRSGHSLYDIVRIDEIDDGLSMKHKLEDILPDYGDRDFVLGILRGYVLDHMMKHMENSYDSDWYYQHGSYANDILQQMGGDRVEIESFKDRGGFLKKYEDN